jgi:AraC-like DNA-binding protein
MTVDCRILDSAELTEARDAVEPVAPAARELHAAVMEGAMGAVLADHLLAFARQLPAMDRADAPAVAKATAGLISACMALNGDGRDERAPESAASTRIRRFIDDNLESEDLTPARICDELGVSRSSLNRALAADGGVTAYVRLRRLDAIRVLLENAAERRSIADIAYGFGFVSDAHFSRSFRQHFGYSPREARLRTAQPATRSAMAGPANDAPAVQDGGARRVPAYGVDLSRLRPQDREAAWRAANGAHFEMRDLPGVVMAKGRAWDMGLMVLTESIHPRQTFVRDAATARRDGVDHLLVSLDVTNGFQLETDRGQEVVPAGRVTVFDVARPQTKLAFEGRTVCLALSRDLVEEVLPGVEMHGLTLGPLGQLMAEHLKSMTEHAPRLDLAAAGLLTLSTAHLLAACVRPSADKIEQARPVLVQALLQRARRYVRANCCDPDLSPEKVAAQIGASRTSLYRAFQPKGGISEYIRLSRLDAARSALADPKDARRVSEIAYAHGFLSEAQFSRAMRAAFGVTPSELRNERHDFRSGYTAENWTQRGWFDAAAPANDAPTGAPGAPAWRPGAAAAVARALQEQRRGAA